LGRVRETRASESTLVGLTTGHGAVWVLEESGAVLRRVSPRALNTVAEIPVGTGSSAVVADSAAVWVANGHAGRLLRIDPRSDRIVARIAVPTSDSVSLAAGGGATWWIDRGRGTAIRIDAKRNATVGSPLRLGGSAGGAAVSGRTLWVAMPSERSVARVRF
jgi:streptogramin lyase